ncbi:MAG: Dabb family protein [Pseudomonadota bacterium]
MTKRLLASFLMPFLLCACTVNLTIDNDEPLAHVVLVWMNEPGNPAHRAQLIAASERLRDIDGVVRVKTGQSIASDRDVVDDSFDVGIYVELESLDALKAYATDPLHLAILNNDIAPVTARYIVYDFEIDR